MNVCPVHFRRKRMRRPSRWNLEIKLLLGGACRSLLIGRPVYSIAWYEWLVCVQIYHRTNKYVLWFCPTSNWNFRICVWSLISREPHFTLPDIPPSCDQRWRKNIGVFCIYAFAPFASRLSVQSKCHCTVRSCPRDPSSIPTWLFASESIEPSVDQALHKRW